MTLPREVLPGRFCMITRRCTQRQFLLRPDTATNNAFAYCLAEAAARYDIEVILSCAMSNHHHTIIFDRHGRSIEFMEHFHKMVARSQNALRGRWENFWASGSPSLVHLAERSDLMDKLVYVATNPVLDGLVDEVHHWPGFNGLRLLLGTSETEVSRPKHFFREVGRMPQAVVLRLALPHDFEGRDEFLLELRDRVGQVEQAHAEERLRTGHRVIGRRRILKQAWQDTPETREPRRALSPRIAARNVWARLDSIQRNREFVTAYREARAALLSRVPIPFPIGTYWLRRFAAVPIAV